MAERPEELSRSIFRGAAILTAAAIITKILSAFYRIPYQNIAGDMGFYIYQQVYPFYGVSLILSTYGFPVVISKLIAEKNREQEEANHIIFNAFIVLSLLGIVLFLAVYFGSGRIAAVMGDSNLSPLLRITSCTFLLMPAVSVIRGYFQGLNEMVPTAASQIVEQSIRVIVIVIFTYILLHHGKSLYDAGAGAVLGSVIGAIASIFTLVTFIWIGKNRISIIQSFQLARVKSIGRAILIQGTAFCISSLLLTLTQLIDAFNLYSLLIGSGMEETAAKELKGVFDRGQPLIQLGSVAATSLSLAVVPLLSSSRARKDNIYLSQKIKLALRVTVTSGIAASVGLICILEPANIMLFTDSSGSAALSILSFSVLFSSLIMIIAAVLQSLGKLWPTMIIILSGLGMKWLFNICLVPLFSIKGAAVSTVLAYALISAALFAVLNKCAQEPLIEAAHIKVWIMSAVSMVIVLLLHKWVFSLAAAELTESRVFASIQALTAVFAGAVVYLSAILKSGIFSPEELSLLPLGSRLSIMSQNQTKKRS